MKKFILLIITVISLMFKVYAGDGDLLIKCSTGLAIQKTAWATIGVEWETKYHNAWEVYFDFATAFKYCEVDKTYLCSETFWDYKTFGIGGGYKPQLYRWRNLNLRAFLFADLGVKEGNSFFLSLDIGPELTYTFKSGIGLFLLQKNEFCFWCRDHFRNGIMIGIKIPLN